MGGIGGIQVAVSLLSTLDVLVGSVVDGATRGLGGYQAMLVFARIPFFVSTALSFVAYPRLAAGRDRERTVRRLTNLYFALSVLTAAAAAGLPAGLVAAVLPAVYVRSLPLLLPLALAGFAAGTVNLLTTFLQAEEAFGRVLRVLPVGLVMVAAVEACLAAPVAHLAWAAAGGNLVVAAAVVCLAGHHFPHASLARRSIVAGAALAGACAVSLSARPLLWVWVPLVVLAGLAVAVWYRPFRRLAFLS